VAGIALFDLDNTLIGREPFRNWATNFCIENALDEPALELLVKLDNGGLASREELFRDFLATYEMHFSVMELIGHYRATYPSFIKPIDAINSSLEHLKQNQWKLGIVTNGPQTQHIKIHQSGLDVLMDIVVVSEEVGVSKPNVAIFEIALNAISMPSPTQGLWMIGDMYATDIAGGQAAGLETILVGRESWNSPGHNPPTYCTNNILEAIDLLLGL